MGHRNNNVRNSGSGGGIGPWAAFGGGEDAPIWSVEDPRLSDADADAIVEQLSTILSDDG